MQHVAFPSPTASRSCSRFRGIIAARGRMYAALASIWLGAGTGCAPGGDEVGESGPGAVGSGGSPTSSSSTSSNSASTGSSSSSNSSSSGASSSGGGGSGTGGQGGLGGSAGGAGGDTGGGGGAVDGAALLLAGGGASVLAAHFQPATGWTATTLLDATTKAPAVVLTGPSSGVGLIRSNANTGELRYTTFSAGTWTPFAAVGPAITTKNQPALAVSNVVARAVFHGDDFKHYFASYSGTWTPAAEDVGNPQSFGPSAPGIATIGPDVVLAFAGDNGDLYDQVRTNNVWQASTKHNLGDVVSITPAIVTMTSGVELLIVLSRKSDNKLLWTGRISGSWTVPQEIDMALSSDRPALAALPGGDAVLAFRGLDGKLYTSRYQATSVPPWSAPAPVANPNFTIPASPAVAAGVGGVDAELAFVEQGTGVTYHARLTGTTWSAPLAVGGTGMTHVALASSP